MKLKKVSDQVVTEGIQASAQSLADESNTTNEGLTSGQAVSRRSFLRNSGLMAGGAVVTSAGFGLGMMKKATAKEAEKGAATAEKKTICTHCSVGCGILAEVQNGVWTGQVPAFVLHFIIGGHCA